MKNNYFLFFLVTLFVILCVDMSALWGGEPPETGAVLGLRQCVELAVKADPEVVNAQDQMEIGLLSTREAGKALVLPTVNLESTYGPKLDFFGRPIADDNIYFSKMSLEKPLYQGGELITSYRLGQAERERAEKDFLRRKAKVSAETVSAYYRLLLAQKQAAYLQVQQGQADRTEEIMTEKLAMGAVLREDLLEARSRKAETRYRLVKARGDLQEAMASLNEQMGRDPGSPVRVVDEFPIAPLDADPERLMDLALQERPDLLYDKADVEYNRLRMRLQKSRALPKVSLIGSYSWEGSDFPGDRKEWAALINFTFSLWNSTLSSSASRNRLLENAFNFVGKDTDYDNTNVRLSLFDGSSNRVPMERARAEYRLAMNRLDRERLAVGKQVRDAENRFREAELLLDATAMGLKFKKEKLEILEEKWRHHDVSEMAVLDARVGLAEARLNHSRALYQKATALAGLYRAVGKRLVWKEKTQ